MQAPSPEQDFVCYRDRGDLPALAAVFDAVAGQLLLVAGHLVRDGALAEDLVQTTFVEAMRCASRYDARRPLLPWLVRILTNQAKKLRRQRGRAADPRPLLRSVDDSAAERVLDREVMTAVEAALAELPIHYRQVLTLRLVHELSPTAIAHALGCPPETVKTRLKRGLELLRRHLPQGITMAMAAWLATGRGLAAMRTEVLRLAAHGKVATTGGAGVTTFGLLAFGGLWMKQMLLRTTVVVVVLALGWFGVDACLPERSAPAAASDAAMLATGDLAAVAAPVPAAERTAVHTPPAAAPEQVVFRGRCIDEASGEPLAGITAAAWREEPKVNTYESQLDLALASGHCVSAADGTFSFGCERSAEVTWSVHVGNREHVQRVRSFGPYAASQVVELGPVPLQRGVQVESRVVDRGGKVVGGVVFSAALRETIGRNETLMEHTWMTVRSAPDGRVVWPHALRPGRYQIWWLDDLPAERSHGEMVVPGDRPTLQNELVWQLEDAGQSIYGRVVDAAGAPLALLHLGAEGGGTRGNARTDLHGRFVMPRVGPFDPAQRGPVRFGLPRPTDGYELKGEPQCQWGDREVELQVAPAALLVVRPIDPRTGQPPAAFLVAYAAQLPEYGGQLAFAWPKGERLPDGAMQFPMAKAPHIVQVFPADAALAPSLKLSWDPRQGQELVVPLTATRRCTVSVLTEAGEPVVGTEVWTLVPIEADGVAALAPGFRDVPLPVREGLSIDPNTRWLRYGIDDAPLASGRTDAAGRVELSVPTNTPLVIAAFGPGHVPKAVVGGPTDDRDVELRVVRGASIRLAITPASLVPRLSQTAGQRHLIASGAKDGANRGVELWIVRMAHEQDAKQPQDVVMVPIEADGVCRHSGLPPGTYELTLAGNLASGPMDGLGVWWPFATVTLREGEEKVVPVDVSRWATGRLCGQVLVNGQPWEFGHGVLTARFSSGSSGVEVVTDADGRFDVEACVGDYRLHLMYRATNNMGYWYAAEQFPVVVGTTTTALFTARRVTTRVCITTAEHQPAAGLYVVMDCATEPRGWQSWTTDEDGWITIDTCPLGPFSLIVSSPSRTGTLADGLPGAPRDALLGLLQVPPLGNTAEFTVALPEGWR